MSWLCWTAAGMLLLTQWAWIPVRVLLSEYPRAIPTRGILHVDCITTLASFSRHKDANTLRSRFRPMNRTGAYVKAAAGNSIRWNRQVTVGKGGTLRFSSTFLA